MQGNFRPDLLSADIDKTSSSRHGEVIPGTVADDKKAYYPQHHFMISPTAQWLPHVATVPPPPFRKVAWRKGKWFDEEEAYTKKLIEVFTNGYLNLAGGTTLRSFLSERLSCDPMRITKKFAGSSCIGKQVYAPCDSKTDSNVIKHAQDELRELEEKFRAKIEAQHALDYYPLTQPAYAPLSSIPSHIPHHFPETYAPDYYSAFALAQNKPSPHAVPAAFYHPNQLKTYPPGDYPSAITLPSVSSVNGIPVYNVIPAIPPSAAIPLVANAGADPFRLLSRYQVEEHLKPLAPSATPTALSILAPHAKLSTAKSLDALNELKMAEGAASSMKIVQTKAMKEVAPTSNHHAEVEKKTGSSTRPRAKSAESTANDLNQKDLYASDLLLNFFKAAQVDGKSEGGSTSSENDSGSSTSSEFKQRAGSVTTEGNYDSPDSEMETKSNSTNTDDEQGKQTKSGDRREEANANVLKSYCDPGGDHKRMHNQVHSHNEEEISKRMKVE